MSILVERRKLRPGTSGWTITDIESDDRLDAEFVERGYELIEGVITRMPAALLDSAYPFARLLRIVGDHLRLTDPGAEFAPECDVRLNDKRVPRADAVYLDAEQRREQARLNTKRSFRGKSLKYGRVVVPPRLIIESISPGHERHDRETKREHYCEGGVHNYWLFDAYTHSLECLARVGNQFVVDGSGRHKDIVRPGAFPGLSIDLAKLFIDD
jgi:Uma2 family endonuclease